jgi:guanine nucleotide-binding protein subunit alpha-13
MCAVACLICARAHAPRTHSPPLYRRRRKVLYDGLAVLDIAMGSPELTQETADWFEALNPTVTTAPIPLFERLWADPGIQEVYARRNRLQLSDGASHYMRSLGRFAKPDYVPTDLDTLHARLPTRGVHEYTFGTDWGQFVMIDVGGQKSERRKWLSAFEHVAAVIFVVASSDFDQSSSASESGGNRLREALQLFSHMMRGKQLRDKSVVLFFNKSDLLKEKLAQGRSVKEHFPEYGGPEGDLVAVQTWLAELFRAQCPGEVYHHFTTAIDTANIKHVFDDMKEILVQSLMRGMGMS